jgi:hypothetical protein
LARLYDSPQAQVQPLKSSDLVGVDAVSEYRSAAWLSGVKRELAALSFDFPSKAGDVESELICSQEDDFRCDFRSDLERLCAWSEDHHWPRLEVGELKVSVSTDHPISKSLVPAWYGRTGYMEFPAWRVARRQAAITHELVHVFFPNGNRLLAEGLAVYLQAALGGNPAFPNFGEPLHRLAHEAIAEMIMEVSRNGPRHPGSVCLPQLDGIATPGPLVLAVGQTVYGEDKRGQARLYPIAGSFVEFLIESRGLDAFRAISARTPLVPLTLRAGAHRRWEDVYGVSLPQLEAEWLGLLRKLVPIATELQANFTSRSTVGRENSRA